MTHWKEFYNAQMEDEELRTLVEEELAALKIGQKIAKLRKEKGLTQTRLAARAGMSASKVCTMESSPQNIELSTLIKIARAGNKRLRVDFA